VKRFEKQSNTPHTYISTPITIGALFQEISCQLVGPQDLPETFLRHRSAAALEQMQWFFSEQLDL
jgi:hypothetical protein